MATPLFAIPLKIARKLYSIANPDSSAFGRNWNMVPLKDYANELIYKALISDKPVMIARLGSTEMLCMTNYLGVKNQEIYKSYRGYIKGQTPPWWWEPAMINQMQHWSGFFPGSVSKIEQFCELMLADMPEVDILGSWLKDEIFFKLELANSKKVMLEDLEPFFTNKPWTKALEGKKVLVVHPFAKTIESQYKHRELLFANKDFLPEFELKIIKAVQSIAGEKTEFSTWFDALDYMKTEIDNEDYDICLIGCGAYGFPLAAHVKRRGKKAFHIGGSLQLLFGIKGKRWENEKRLGNEYWVFPGDDETPNAAYTVEGGCYW